ncbi:MAG: SUMF1/EgtB/PvdO family nonheme iron enzyme [Candidatus Eisenbacteria bacterium]
MIRSSIGGDLKGDENLPGMAGPLPKTRPTLGIPKDETREWMEKYPADEPRKLIAGSSPEFQPPEIEPYLIDLYEVTNLQYRTFLQATNRQPSAKLIEYHWPNGEIPKGQENHPVAAVNLLEAKACARWMGKRIPTEAEWEAAARGPDPEGKANRFSWGKTWDHTKCANQRTTRGGQTAAVGSFPDDKSPLGVFDMMGNVSEWTSSVYTGYPGFKPPEVVDPVSKKQITVRPGFGSLMYVVKGGNCVADQLLCNVWSRNSLGLSNRLEMVGFRCAKSRLPGVDALEWAIEDLPLASEVTKNPMNLKDVCAQEILQLDPAQNYLITSYKTLALGHMDTLRGPWIKLLTDGIENPIPVAVLTTTEKLEYPKLSAGSYAILFKPAGTPKKKDVAKAEEKKPENHAGKEKPRDEAKAKEKEKDGDKDPPKSGGKDSPKAAPKDAPKDPAAAKEAAKEAARAKQEAEDQAAAQAELDRIRGGGDVQEDVKYPLDHDVFLFKAPNGKIAAYADVPTGRPRKRTKAIFSTDALMRARMPKAIMVTNGKPANALVHPSAEEVDVATFEFTVASQSQNANPALQAEGLLQGHTLFELELRTARSAQRRLQLDAGRTTRGERSGSRAAPSCCPGAS